MFMDILAIDIVLRWKAKASADRFLTIMLKDGKCGKVLSPLLQEIAIPLKLANWNGWLVVLRLNVPVNNFSVMSGQSHRFLGN